MVRRDIGDRVAAVLERKIERASKLRCPVLGDFGEHGLGETARKRYWGFIGHLLILVEESFNVISFTYLFATSRLGAPRTFRIATASVR